MNYLRTHENILVISIISRRRWFKRVDDLVEQFNGHAVLDEQNMQSMNRCLHRMAPPEKYYMAESSVQVAEVNTQAAVPELPVNFRVKSPVNLPDVGDPISDSQPVKFQYFVIFM